MQARGWKCSGSLPVSSPANWLSRYEQEINAADLIVINGEGSIHHDSKNATHLFEISKALVEQNERVVLINALWQQNSPDKWKPVIAKFSAAYCRDKKSQKELMAIYPAAGYAPDLTFFDYPVFPNSGAGFACTDSVLNKWSRFAMQAAKQDPELDYLTMFTGNLKHRRGTKDWAKQVKYFLYPLLIKYLGLKLSPRYHALSLAYTDTDAFIQHLNSFKAVCVARYHTLCFTIQQEIPFVAVGSNSHKSEALLEELGLPLDVFTMQANNPHTIKENLIRAAHEFPHYKQQISDFNQNAKNLINEMFDDITETE